MPFLDSPNQNVEASYNNVQWLTVYKSRFAAKPVLDEARRTTVHVEHTVELDGYIASNPTNPGLTAPDHVMPTLRAFLTQPGANLVIKGKGYGDLVVNDRSSPVRDVAWGPHPEILEFIPLGGDCNAARVLWRCVTRIPECPGFSAGYKFPRVLAFNYEVTYTIDQDGYTTIRTSGYVEIPMTRTTPGSRQVPASADQLREDCRPNVPLNFRRKEQSFRLSKDKRREDFDFLDEEMPAPLPGFSSRCDMRQSLESGLGSAFRKWSIRFDADVTIARGKPKSSALAVFLQVVNARLDSLRKATPQVLLPTHARYEDVIFDRPSRFELFFQLIEDATIDQTLARSGMWQKIPGVSAQEWRLSMTTAGVNDVRGFARAKNVGSNDAILDLCIADTVPGAAMATDAVALPALNPGQSAISADDTERNSVRNLSPRVSWLLYAPQVRYIETANVARHKPLPRPAGGQTTLTAEKTARQTAQTLASQKAAGAGAGTSAIAGVDAVMAATGGMAAPPAPSGLPADVFQRAAAPTRWVVLSGIALRLAYRIPVPRLDSVGGVPCVELHRDVQEWQPAALGNVLIFALRWRIVYALGSLPQGNFPYLANPAWGTEGGTGDLSALKP